MGKYLDKFKKIGPMAKKSGQFIDRKVQQMAQGKQEKKDYPDYSSQEEDFDEEMIPGEKEEDWRDEDRYDDMNIQQAQKPESFHHFILENQYKDLERSIRGFKDVFDKQEQTWKVLRKESHCFTDEEAEEILRTAQSHLATDIKLGYINRESFPVLMDTIYQEIAFLFESIAEYRYGRYKTYEKQYEMKLQNHKIFLELFTRIQANYSRAIAGMENKYTHESVKGQESLQQDNQDLYVKRRYT